MHVESSDHTDAIEKLRKGSAPSRFAYYGDISTAETWVKDIDLTSTISLEDPAHPSDLLEFIIAWFQKDYGLKDILFAKNEFQNSAGRVFPDEHAFHLWMDYFLNYFVLQKILPQPFQVEARLRTPLDCFLESKDLEKNQKSDEITNLFLSLRNFSHSFFLITKSTRKRVVIKNIEDQRFYDLRMDLDFSEAFPKKSILQGFIFHSNQGAILSKGIFLHPPAVFKIIEKTVKKQIKDIHYNSTKTLFDFAKKYLLHTRNPNLDIKKIYNTPRQ